MKLIAKSFVIAVIATGLFFSFLMLFVVPAMAVMTRTQGGAQQMTDVTVDPTPFLRHFGLPLSGLVFLTAFGFSLRQSTKAKSELGIPERSTNKQ